jgi:uncharacterized membrane protein YqaE (UPF0057 family)
MGKFKDWVNKAANKILNAVLFPIRPLITPIEKLVESMEELIKLIYKLISVLPKILQLFYELTDPVKFIKDIKHGINAARILIFNSILDILFGNLANNYKIITSDNDKDKSHKYEKEDCIQPTFIELLILILCPPLAIFIRKGLKGTLTILITTLLTYFYYLPGVIFASLYIL